MKKLQIAAALTALTILPVLAFAQVVPPKSGGAGNIPSDVGFVQPSGTGIQQIIGIIDTVSRLMLYALLILSGLFIVYAAYLYLTAAGDGEKVKSASNVIIYAAVAIAVGLLSRVIVAIARGLVQ